ncbi:MAG: hypothetical protein ACQET5_07375 [Halobacteriota archaeon]|uniref:hypothetical protein n=1 Tax=Natronomonas sp. TaxID=2184060 RepID=UPI003976CF42
MSDEDSSTGAFDGGLRSPLRLVCYGLILSGLLTLLVATVSTRPHGITAFGLGGLAVSTLVFERTQGGAMGLSLGFLTGSIAAWLWPTIGDGGFYFLGAVLVTAGAVNAVLLPPFYRLGQQLGAGSRPPQ